MGAVGSFGFVLSHGAAWFGFSQLGGTEATHGIKHRLTKIVPFVGKVFLGWGKGNRANPGETQVLGDAQPFLILVAQILDPQQIQRTTLCSPPLDLQHIYKERILL